MSDSASPNADDLRSSRGAAPPRRQLVLWTLTALLGAALLLVLVVLPAEYGVDPTGFGGLIGLTDLSEGSSAGSLDLASAEGYQFSQSKAFRSEILELPLAAYEEIEFKFGMVQDASLVYSWSSGGVPLYVDFHGHPYNDLDGTEVRYAEQEAQREDHGGVRAPYSGMHGWYWRNESDQPTTVTLQVSGHYTHHEEMLRARFDPGALRPGG